MKHWINRAVIVTIGTLGGMAAVCAIGSGIGQAEKLA